MIKIFNYNERYSDDGIAKKLYDTRFSLFKVEDGKIIFYNFIADKFFKIEKNDINNTTIKKVFGKEKFNPCPDNKYAELVALLKKSTLKEMLEERQRIYEEHNKNRKNQDLVGTRRPWLNCLNKLLIDVDPNRRGHNYERMVNKYEQPQKIQVPKKADMGDFEYAHIAADTNNKLGWSGTGGAVSSEILSLLHLLEYKNKVNNNFKNNVLPTLKGGFVGKGKINTIFEQLREIVEIVNEGRKNNAKWVDSLLTLLNKYNIIVENNSKKPTIDSKKSTKGGSDIKPENIEELRKQFWRYFTTGEKDIWKRKRYGSQSRLLGEVMKRALIVDKTAPIPKTIDRVYTIMITPNPRQLLLPAPTAPAKPLALPPPPQKFPQSSAQLDGILKKLLQQSSTGLVPAVTTAPANALTPLPAQPQIRSPAKPLALPAPANASAPSTGVVLAATTAPAPVKLKLENTSNMTDFKKNIDNQISSISYYEQAKKYIYSSFIKNIKDSLFSLYKKANNLPMGQKLIILAIIIGTLYAAAKYYKSRGPNYTGGLPDNLKNITNKSKFLEKLIITNYSDIEWELNNYITNTKDDITIYNKLIKHADNAKQGELSVFLRRLAECVTKAAGILEIIKKNPDIINYEGTGIQVREKLEKK